MDTFSGCRRLEDRAFVLLGTWWVIAAVAIWLVQRVWCSKHRAENPRRYRFWFAVTIGIVFTPSLISDFWLFGFLGPAIFGSLLCFLAACGCRLVEPGES